MRVVWLGAVGKGQAMRKTNFLPGVLGLLAAVPWCPAAAPEPPPAAPLAYIYADWYLWEAKPVRDNVRYTLPYGVAERTITLSMRNIPVREVIRYVCASSYSQYRLKKEGIVFSERVCALRSMSFQIFTVTPAFEQAVGHEVCNATVRNYLSSIGVDFLRKIYKVNYLPNKRLLFLRHGAPELQEVEMALKARGMLVGKAFEYGGLLPPPLAKLPYRHKLDLVIPLVEADEVPVGKFLLQLARQIREVDPEHQGINLIFCGVDTEKPVVLDQADWQQCVVPVSTSGNAESPGQ